MLILKILFIRATILTVMIMKSEIQHVTHGFEPVFDHTSRILILGSMPSQMSRQAGFYYGNPRNRFWQVLCEILGEPLPDSIESKRSMLLRRHIALWDVIQSCDIRGSADSEIKNIAPTELGLLLGGSIKAVFANGKKAAAVYEKYQKERIGMDIITLPSTSPANAACSLQKLIEEWRVILKYI